jgi:hypothetical protein
MQFLRVWSVLTLGVLFIQCMAAGLEKDDLELVYTEDFESGHDGWTTTDPAAWKLEKDGEENTVLSLFGPSSYRASVRSPYAIAWIDDLEVTDFILEARLKQRGREYNHRDLCLFFGKQSPERFYYVHMATQADANAHSVFIVNDAPRTSIAKERTEGVDWGSEWRDIRIVRDTESGRIEVYFDDMETPVMVAEDKTFLSGAIGVGSFDDVGWFDDIKIWAKPKR